MRSGLRTPRSTGRRRPQDDGANGQVLVIFALSFTVILAICALVIDVGILRTDGARLQNALDSAALAAAVGLPAGSDKDEAGQTAIDAVRQTAIKYAKGNMTGVPAGWAPKVDFRCLVGYDPLSRGPRIADLLDVPGACYVSIPRNDPGWRCTGETCWAPCNPDIYPGDICNTIVLSATFTRAYAFGPAIGVNSGTVGSEGSELGMAAACTGACGQPVDTADIIVIVDRTASLDKCIEPKPAKRRHGEKHPPDPCKAEGRMTRWSVLLDGTDALFATLVPPAQRIALGGIGPSRTDETCTDASGASIPGAYGTPITVKDKTFGDPGDRLGPETWTAPSPTDPEFLNSWISTGQAFQTGVGAPFDSSYQLADGQVNTGSLVWQTLNCMNPSLKSKEDKEAGSSLSLPIAMATEYFKEHGRRKADGTPANWIIVLETDGELKEPKLQDGHEKAPRWGQSDVTDQWKANYLCSTAMEEAQKAKALGIEIYAVGYGLDRADPNGKVKAPKKCPRDPDDPPMVHGQPKPEPVYVTDALSNIATPPANGLDAKGHAYCNAAENLDGDHFFCAPDGEDLAPLFRTIGAEIARKAHLVQLYPQPEIAGLSPSSGIRGTVVTITGAYFINVTSVTFGGAPAASVQVIDERTLRVVVPAGVVGPVQVVVTTPGGASGGATFTYLR